MKDRMSELGVTQLRLAELSGILQPRISDYLTGKRDVTGESLRKLLEALDLEIRPVSRRSKKGR